ncbi:hypothetical protein [Lentisalinibacter orientalis]|uniref:hypothetical protein n=1 Tax=Lentisalinibacter orientalis TaxID=2992241 RepID=UPI0038688178
MKTRIDTLPAAGLKAIPGLALLLALAACGGGGGGGDTTTNPPPPPPPPPPPSTYSIGGTVSGLAGSGLTLRNNGGDDLAVSANGSFAFATEIDSGDTYSVTVATQPASPDQTCTVTNGSGTATADVTDVAVACETNTAATDTDGDGLTDSAELQQYGTSPILADTDGDGYSDFDELITNGFDPAVNNFVFNPRVADVPVVLIRIQETPIIGWNYVEGTAQGTTTSTSRSQAQTNSTSTSYGASTTIGVEATTTATVGASVSGPSAEVSQSVSVSASATVSFDQTNTSENRTAWEEMQANNVETTRDTESGFMRFGVRIENGGHLTFRIESLSLASTRTSEGKDPFTPTGTLNLDGAQSFPATSISQGNETPLLTFEQNDIDLGTVRSLLNNTRSIQVEPLYEIADRNGLPFPFQEQDIANNTAKIVIDYGPYRETEFYQVATNTVPNAPGQTLQVLLDEFLRVPTTSDGSGLTTVRGEQSAVGRWVVTRNRKRDTETETAIFDPEDANYALADIEVRARDEVLLVLLEDSDGDGIGYREERLHGTDPDEPDTDGDGLSDFEEIRETWTVTAVNQIDPNRYPATVSSSPIAADYDGDLVADADERDRGLDPYNRDTDGDGIDDFTDTDNGNLPLVNSTVVAFGSDPFGDAALESEYAVQLTGSVTANAPNVPANVDIDWRSDGTDVTSFQVLSGGNASLSIDSKFLYDGAGQWTLTLDAVDDSTPPNSLTETATIVFTEPTRPQNVYGYVNGWRTQRHVRQVIDIDEDGHADIVGLSNSDTTVALGSPGGFSPREVWSTGNWHYGIYDDVNSEPRLFADIDGARGLEIVGVDITGGGALSTAVVRYGRNSGSAFEDPLVWIADLAWRGASDNAYVADVDNSGFPDFVHASAELDAIQAYTSSGSSLELTQRDATPLPAGEVIDRTTYPLEVADLDGDGCADVVYFGSTDTWVAQARCDGSFEDFVVLTPNFGRNDDRGWDVVRNERWVDDITSDGLPDIVAVGSDRILVLVNQSASGDIKFAELRDFGDAFTNRSGWAPFRDIHVRYLADVNADGYKDLVGYNGGGAAIGINRLGIDGTPAFAQERIVATDFKLGANLDGNGDDRWFADDPTPCDLTPCREFFPRQVGDVDGDNRADLVGFDRAGIVYQPMPYVTQFE